MITILGIILLTIAIYFMMVLVYKKFKIPILLPILSSTVCIIVLLIVLHISYNTYMLGGVWINHLLGPAVVALAYPLYKERIMIKENFIPIIGGVLTGTTLAIAGVWVSASLIGINPMLIFTLLPKSVTTPVALGISQEIGGVPPLTASFVMIAGILGSIVGPYLFNFFRIHHVLGRGVGYGSASHAIGTSKALEENGITGAASSVAMILSAIISSVVIPILIAIFK